MANNTVNSSPARSVLVIIVVAIVAIVGYAFLTMPDRRTTGEKIGDAVDALPQGPDKAIRQLEDRTPGERLGDAVKDAGDDIKRNTDN